LLIPTIANQPAATGNINYIPSGRLALPPVRSAVIFSANIQVDDDRDKGNNIGKSWSSPILEDQLRARIWSPAKIHRYCLKIYPKIGALVRVEHWSVGGGGFSCL